MKTSLYILLSLIGFSIFIGVLSAADKPKSITEIVLEMGEIKGRYLLCKKTDYNNELKYFESILIHNSKLYGAYSMKTFNISYNCNDKELKKYHDTMKNHLEHVTPILFHMNAKKYNQVYI